jgi:hypothetical protein
MHKKLVVLMIAVLVAGMPLAAQQDSSSDGNSEGGSSAQATSAEEASWGLGRYPYDVEQAKDSIAKAVKGGLAPVGLAVEEGKAISVLYSRTDAYSADRWSIHTFDNPESLEKEMNTILDRGWVPMGLSRSGQGLYGLFVHTGSAPEAWRIHRSPKDSESITEAIKQFRSEGFRLFDVSTFEDSAWYVFVTENESSEQPPVLLRRYSFSGETLRPAVNAAIDDGLLPWGLAKEGDTVSVLFSR